ncbi:MAG: hypothetical protein QXP39_00105 [Candidatus Aenigmatarchaeota archaeon]
MASNKLLAALILVLLVASLVGMYILIAPLIPVAPAIATETGVVSLYVAPQPYSTGGMVSVVVIG